MSVSPSGEIVEGSSVPLTCSSDANPPVDKYTWYKKNVTSPKASGQSYSITSISSEDRGDYYCEAMNIRGTETSIPVHINVMCKYVMFCLFLVLCDMTVLTDKHYKHMYTWILCSRYVVVEYGPKVIYIMCCAICSECIVMILKWNNCLNFTA